MADDWTPRQEEIIEKLPQQCANIEHFTYATNI